MFTRRTATVIISAPDASCARAISAGDEYFPVPTMSLEVNILSAMVKVSAIVGLPAAYEVDDFDFIAFADRRALERVALDDDEVVLDGDAARIDVELSEQRVDAHRCGDFEWIAVHSDQHCKCNSI